MSKRKKIFWDMEFTGLHKLSTPLSIGLVAEDGREFYAEFTDFDEMQINQWLIDNVMSHLVLGDYDFVRDYKPDDKLVKVKGDTELIAQTLGAWLDFYKEDGVEMWGDCLAYDWVLFVSIFGSAFDIPEHILYLPMDLCTALKLCRQDPDTDRVMFVYGSEDKIPASDIGTHNSLYDARIMMEVYKKILGLMVGAGNESLNEEPAKKDAADFDPTEAIEEHTSEEDVQVIEEEQPPVTLPEITSDVQDNGGNSQGFIEPSQEEVNEGGEQWNPPL
jgi:hypothetical protein